MSDDYIIEAMALAICDASRGDGYGKEQSFYNIYEEMATSALAAYRNVAGNEIAALRERAEKAKRERDELKSVLQQAYDAMNYMGDILNNMDAVLDEDIAATKAAFDLVRAALGQENEP